MTTNIKLVNRLNVRRTKEKQAAIAVGHPEWDNACLSCGCEIPRGRKICNLCSSPPTWPQQFLRARKLAKLTQAGAASALTRAGIETSTNAVESWEQGRRRPEAFKERLILAVLKNGRGGK